MRQSDVDRIVEEKMLDLAGHNMAKHIDFEVLKNVLINSCGWHYVELPTLGSNKRAIDIADWAHIECGGKWKHLGRHWLFEQEEDAILFKLTWS